jgi:hypothetical protein
MGWEIDRQNGPLRVDETKSNIESPVALLQAWLFFGFLKDVFSIGRAEIDLHEFQKPVEGISCLSTAALKNSLDSLERAAWLLEPDACVQRQKQVTQCFKTFLNFFERHWASRAVEGSWKVSSILSLDHIMVFVILGETIKNAIFEVWPVPTAQSPLRCFGIFRFHDSLRNRLLQAGWCPSEASMLNRELDHTGIFIASMLKRPFSDKLSHKSCSHVLCSALQTSEDDYETKHTDDCTSCSEIVIDQEKTSSILRNGGIPIIYIHPMREGELPRVKTLDYNANSLEYFAISHVWAHGRGNPRKNALPLCQLVRIQSLVGKSSQDGKARQPAFWIDTLCIPVDPQFKEYRKIAITRLNDTFRHARQVLVLDADLERCSKRCSRTELATRILCSAWMRRLWTLCEAVVADETTNTSKVDIQFLDGSLEFNAVAGRYFMSIYNTEDAIKTVFSSFPQFPSRDRAYSMLTRSLLYRTTSKLEDEAICIASILGFKPGDIGIIARAKTAEERTQLMYTMMDQIPASVLFNRSKKLTQGFRWAPATLIGGNAEYVSAQAGRCDAQGLHARYSGYIVTRSKPGWGSRYIGDPNEQEPKLHIVGLGNYGETTTNQSTMETAEDFERFFRETPTAGFVLNPHEPTESALVSVSREEGGVIYATFERRIYMFKPKMQPGRHERWRDHVVDAREVSSEQMWCIQ